MPKKKKRFNLLAATYELLDASAESITGIARSSGVNYHWLVKFTNRRHANPGVTTVQKLYDYLIEKTEK